MKKIGFVDYYISEWHADNYPAWIKEANEKLGLDYEVAYAWAEMEVSPISGETTSQWCQRMNVTQCATIEEICEKSDVLLILAPSNPEKHLGYAQAVLPYGKRTYIDKTFAPDLATAKEIFRIAKEHNTAFFSSSALRYAEELLDLTDAQNLIFTGGGRSLEEYVIHQVEMAVSLLKDPAAQVTVEHFGQQRVCSIVTETGKKAAVVYASALPFTVTCEDSQKKTLHKSIQSAFFVRLIMDILRFYQEGTTSFDVQETLEAMRLREGILKADQQPGIPLKLA